MLGVGQLPSTMTPSARKDAPGDARRGHESSGRGRCRPGGRSWDRTTAAPMTPAAAGLASTQETAVCTNTGRHDPGGRCGGVSQEATAKGRRRRGGLRRDEDRVVGAAGGVRERGAATKRGASSARGLLPALRPADPSFLRAEGTGPLGSCTEPAVGRLVGTGGPPSFPPARGQRWLGRPHLLLGAGPSLTSRSWRRSQEPECPGLPVPGPWDLGSARLTRPQPPGTSLLHTHAGPPTEQDAPAAASRLLAANPPASVTPPSPARPGPARPSRERRLTCWEPSGCRRGQLLPRCRRGRGARRAERPPPADGRGPPGRGGPPPAPAASAPAPASRRDKVSAAAARCRPEPVPGRPRRAPR